MYSRKRKGAYTNPSGTLQVILKIFDAKPVIDTHCLQSAKYDSNHLFANPGIP